MKWPLLPFPSEPHQKGSSRNCVQDFLPCTTSSRTLTGQAGHLLRVVQSAATRPLFPGSKVNLQWQPGKQPLFRKCHKNGFMSPKRKFTSAELSHWVLCLPLYKYSSSLLYFVPVLNRLPTSIFSHQQTTPELFPKRKRKQNKSTLIQDYLSDRYPCQKLWGGWLLTSIFFLHKHSRNYFPRGKKGKQPQFETIF